MDEPDGKDQIGSIAAGIETRDGSGQGRTAECRYAGDPFLLGTAPPFRIRVSLKHHGLIGSSLEQHAQSVIAIRKGIPTLRAVPLKTARS